MKEQRAYECHCAVAQKLTPLHLSEMAEGARFENPEALETIGPISFHRLVLNHLQRSQRQRKEPVKTDRTR